VRQYHTHGEGTERREERVVRDTTFKGTGYFQVLNTPRHCQLVLAIKVPLKKVKRWEAKKVAFWEVCFVVKQKRQAVQCRHCVRPKF
jgi:hypothetical protein